MWLSGVVPLPECYQTYEYSDKTARNENTEGGMKQVYGELYQREDRLEDEEEDLDSVVVSVVEER